MSGLVHLPMKELRAAYESLRLGDDAQASKHGDDVFPGHVVHVEFLKKVPQHPEFGSAKGCDVHGQVASGGDRVLADPSSLHEALCKAADVLGEVLLGGDIVRIQVFRHKGDSVEQPEPGMQSSTTEVQA